MTWNGIIGLAFCLILVPVLVGYAIGWAVRDRSAKRQPQPTSSWSPATTPPTTDHVSWLLAELERAPFTTTLSLDQRITLKAHYAFAHPSTPTFTPTQPAPMPDPIVTPEPVAPAPPIEPIAQPTSVTPVTPLAATPLEPTFLPDEPTTPRRSPMEIDELPAYPDTPPSARALDPAVVLLYLGAFLIVAAGLIYASYTWSDLGVIQKLGMLALVTLAFAGGGYALLASPRVRPAAETFVAIGALLVPANAIAAATVVTRTDARLGLIVLIGSTVTAAVYTVFAYRPGGRIYAYGAVTAAFLAIGALPAALGLAPEYGAIPVLLVVAAAPEITMRLRGDRRRFRCALGHVNIAAFTIAMLVGIGGSTNETIWLLPATFAAATIALGRLAWWRATSPHAAGATITALGTIGGLLVAADVSALPTTFVLMFVGLGWPILSERGPVLLQERRVRMLVHTEAIALLLAAVGTAIIAERDWLLTLTFVALAIGATIVSELRANRWLLLLTGIAATYAYLTIPLYTDRATDSAIHETLYVAVIPIALALAAIVLDTRSGRPRWSEPLWILAGLAAIGSTGYLANTDDTSLLWLKAALAIVFAIGALIAAMTLRQPLVRFADGVWWLTALSFALATHDGLPDDRLAVALIAIALIALPSIPRIADALADRLALLRLLAAPRPAWELAVFGIAGGITLATMIAGTIAWIADGSGIASRDIGIRWTWITYLAIYAAIAIGSGAIGFRRRHDPRMLRLAEIALAFGLLVSAMLLRMRTTDPIAWTWGGIAIAGILLTIAIALQQQHPASPYGRHAIRLSLVSGLAIGTCAIAANLALTGLEERDANPWVQTGLYLGIAIALFVTSLLHRRPLIAGGAIASLAISVAFANDALDGDHVTLGIALLALGWVLTGTSLAFRTIASLNAQRPIWRLGAMILAGVTILIALTTDDLARNSREWQLLAIGLLSLAGMLVVDGRLRHDPRRLLAASIVAMGGVLVEIAATEPANIQAYTVPIALYLFALGWSQRAIPTTRDLLLGTGATILIAPPFAQALAGDGFVWVLVGGGEALLLVLIGLALRLRVLIAAGIVAITLVVLRMLVDAVNALPSWSILLVVGVMLLAGGTVMVAWRDALQRQIERLRQRWEAMG